VYYSYGYGSHGSVGGVVVHEGEQPAEEKKAGGAEQGEQPSAPEPGDSSFYGNDAAQIIVMVPAAARIYVNDRPTTSTGELRRFISRGLQPGHAYTYEVRAEYDDGGRVARQTKVVQLEAGNSAELMFDFQQGGEPIRTTLILRVPADAKVTLAGNPTASSGEKREFTTTRLNEGEEWANYPIRVEVERNGQTLVKEEKITLKAGESREILIDPTAPAVATR
jgi:uncharacterized protein (TIGR03000 family)